MDTGAKPVYTAIAARRPEAAAPPRGVKLALLLALAAVIAVMLLRQQQARHGTLIHMRHTDDVGPEHEHGCER